MKKNTNYHHGDLRAALVMAAINMLDREGPEKVGIRQIARDAGVAHSAPANHFKNKQALMTALAREIFDELVTHVQKRSESGTGNLRQAIRQFAITVLDYSIRYPHRYRLLWRRDILDFSDEALDTAMERLYQHLISVLYNYRSNKHTDIESQAIAIWSLIHGYASLRMDNVLDTGQDEVTGIDRQTAIIDVIIDGL